MRWSARREGRAVAADAQAALRQRLQSHVGEPGCARGRRCADTRSGGGRVGPGGGPHVEHDVGVEDRVSPAPAPARVGQRALAPGARARGPGQRERRGRPRRAAVAAGDGSVGLLPRLAHHAGHRCAARRDRGRVLVGRRGRRAVDRGAARDRRRSRARRAQRADRGGGGVAIASIAASHAAAAAAGRRRATATSTTSRWPRCASASTRSTRS